MKKYTILIMLILCLGLFQVAFGQGPKFGVGGVLGFPTGTWSDYVGSVAFGGTGQVLFPMGENMAIGGQAGYMIFGGEDVQFGTTKYSYDYSAIPILGVFRYYLGVPAVGAPRWFVGGLAGFHLFQASAETETVFLGQTIKAKQDFNSTEFSFAPMGGVAIGNLEAEAFYMIISDLSYFGARLGYNFGQ